MKNSKYIKYSITSPSKLETMRKMLHLHSLNLGFELNKTKRYLRYGIVEVLSFYMIYGYNKETFDLITDSLGINMRNLYQINSELTKLKCLEQDKYNKRKKHLSSTLLKFKDFVMLNEDKTVIVDFNEK